MSLSSRSGLLGFLLALPAMGLPASNAALNPSPDPAVPLEATTEIERAAPPLTSVEERLQRLAAVIRSQEKELAPGERPADNSLTAAAWGNGNGRRAFVNGHPYYGRPGFINGGGGWRNGGAAWRNGGGGSAWRNGGGGFRNW
jgi:rSAM-associated Gly-rich repeat protein